MPDPSCHYCERAAESECPTCGRLYCPEHGEDVCLRCLSPDSATPGALAYRGSLVALGLASIVAVFLLVNPPESPARTDEPQPVATNTPAFEATATPTEPAPGEDGDGEPQPTTIIATPTPPPDDEGTDGDGEAPEEIHTVEEGESLSGIAETYDVTEDAILEANPDISDPAAIVPGQEIVIPGSE